MNERPQNDSKVGIQTWICSRRRGVRHRSGSDLEVSLCGGNERGGAFFLVFVLFTILLGYPCFWGICIRPKSQSDAIGTYQKIAPGTPWVITGWIGIAACFLVLSFYSVIGGWILLYIIKGVTGSLSGLTQAGYGELFGSIIQDPLQTLAAQLAFIIMTILVVAKGVQKESSASVRL